MVNLPVPDSRDDVAAQSAGMAADPGTDESGPGPEQAAPGPEKTALTRQQLDEVFGDVLPTLTRDELDDRPEEVNRAVDSDRWYRENRPPHHG